MPSVFISHSIRAAGHEKMKCTSFTAYMWRFLASIIGICLVFSVHFWRKQVNNNSNSRRKNEDIKAQIFAELIQVRDPQKQVSCLHNYSSGWLIEPNLVAWWEPANAMGSQGWRGWPEWEFLQLNLILLQRRDSQWNNSPADRNKLQRNSENLPVVPVSCSSSLSVREKCLSQKDQAISASLTPLLPAPPQNPPSLSGTRSK